MGGSADGGSEPDAEEGADVGRAGLDARELPDAEITVDAGWETTSDTGVCERWDGGISELDGGESFDGSVYPDASSPIRPTAAAGW